MDIPAIYSVLKGGEIRAAPVAINGTDISFESEPVVPEYSVEGFDERMPLVVVDVKGLGKENMDDKLLYDLVFRGSDVWFLSFIRTVEDVFDCFMGNVVKVLIPYHTTADDLVMKEIYEVSENCTPVLFVLRGRVAHRNGDTTGIMPSIDEMAKIGFPEIVVFDTDSSLSDDDWIDIADRFRNVIPYVRNRDRSFEGSVYETVISDFR